MKKYLLPISVCIFLSACQQSTYQTEIVNHKNDVSIPQKHTQIELITQDPWLYVQSEIKFDINDNYRIDEERKKLLRSVRYFENNLAKSEPYIYYIVNQLRIRNMPVELALLPLLESAYNPLATSYAKSTGLWQIAPITAKQYGLTKNSWYDSRKDFIESTETALTILQTLNERFDGDWLLTLAAYNAGEGRVKRAIAWNKEKGLPTHYWALNLAQETMQYVPRMLAMIDIIKHNDQYALTLPNCDHQNALVKINVDKQIDLNRVAKQTSIELNDLLTYNAGHLKKTIKEPHYILIPAIYADEFYTFLTDKKLTSSMVEDLLYIDNTMTSMAQTPILTPTITNQKYDAITDADLKYYQQEHKRYSQIIYKVKSGDNLSRIAKNHNVKVNDLIKWNKITNADKLKLGDKLIINIKNGSSVNS